MATQPPYDDELLRSHLAQADQALPGPDYYAVLQWIHESLKPRTYVEIGIRQGESLRCAAAGTICVGIDPEPAVRDSLPSTTQVFAMTSDEFFASQNLADVIGSPNFALAFIDGLHLFEQALRDFINLEKFSGQNSLVMIHDCLPLDMATSSRSRSTHFYSGDIWKLALCLKRNRPDLKIKTVRTGPTGLCLVGGLHRESNVLAAGYEKYGAEYVGLTFEDYRTSVASMPETVANSPAAVSACIEELTRV